MTTRPFTVTYHCVGDAVPAPTRWTYLSSAVLDLLGRVENGAGPVILGGTITVPDGPVGTLWVVDAEARTVEFLDGADVTDGSRVIAWANAGFLRAGLTAGLALSCYGTDGARSRAVWRLVCDQTGSALVPGDANLPATPCAHPV